MVSGRDGNGGEEDRRRVGERADVGVVMPAEDDDGDISRMEVKDSRGLRLGCGADSGEVTSKLERGDTLWGGEEMPAGHEALRVDSTAASASADSM